MPTLKTSNISASSTLAWRWMRVKKRVELEADRRGDAAEVEQAVAGDVDQRFDAGDGAQDLQRLAHVDVGRAQQLFAERDGELVEFVVDRKPMVGEERLARERKPVAVDAAALHRDDDVALAHGAPVRS